MTEEEWLACDDPQEMLFDSVIAGATDRKLRLFVIARCRRVWHLLSEEGTRPAVAVAERYADDAVTIDELERAFKRVRRIWEDMEPCTTPEARAAHHARTACYPDIRFEVRYEAD